MIINCIVACRNSNGEPDLFFVKVDCTSDQYNNGEHYDAAKKQAELEGYEAPFVAFDDCDSAGRAMLPLCAYWDTTEIVDLVQSAIKENKIESCQEQIQNDLLCLLDEAESRTQLLACQIVVDNFAKYGLMKK